MGVLQAFKMGISGVLGNKMRSLLTMLGVIIGVASVIVLVSLAAGATKGVTDRLQSMGSNLLTVNIRGRGNQGTLSLDDINKWADMEEILYIAPVVNGSALIKAGTETMQVTVEGSTAAYHEIGNLKVETGRGLCVLDDDSREHVAVIGSEVATELFGSALPVGESLRVFGLEYSIVGVLESQGSSIGGSSDTRILIPFSTAQRALQSTGIRQVNIQARDAAAVDTVMETLETDLFMKYQNTDYYNIFNQSQLLETVTEATAMLSAMIGGIAGISLLVGGIGIMNIMLVSVTERTREIGVRKAIGAKKMDILTQFMIEAVVISATGGLIGVAGGIGLSMAVEQLFESLTTAISMPVIGIAFGFSLVVGIVFGVYPAWRASSLNPIEALRM
ncbi:MAG: ABC transporter permease [Peptococcaceae bacterium]|jgi:putative ABC transport system permease protein|nr:ABC transporter permease [Peptococcaceae bacterium]